MATGLVLTPVKEGPQAYRLAISGKVGRTEVRGRTGMVNLGLYLGEELPRSYTVTVNKAEGGKLGFATQRKVEDAVRLKFEELRDQVAEEIRVERRDRNPTDDMDRGLILDEGEIFAKVGSHRQREKVYRVLGRKPQTYYNLFEGDKTAGASRFVVTEEEFQKLKDGRVKVTRSRLKVPNEWHPHINFGGRDANPQDALRQHNPAPATTAAALTQRLKF